MGNMHITGKLTLDGGGKVNNRSIVTIGNSLGNSSGRVTLVSSTSDSNFYRFQWGTFSRCNTSFTFPTPFELNCYQVLVCGSANQWEAINVQNISKTGFTPTSRADATAGIYFAIGR